MCKSLLWVFTYAGVSIEASNQRILTPTYRIKFHLSHFWAPKFQNFLREHGPKPPTTPEVLQMPTLIGYAASFRTYWNACLWGTLYAPTENTNESCYYWAKVFHQNFPVFPLIHNSTDSHMYWVVISSFIKILVPFQYCHGPASQIKCSFVLVPRNVLRQNENCFINLYFTLFQSGIRKHKKKNVTGHSCHFFSLSLTT